MNETETDYSRFAEAVPSAERVADLSLAAIEMYEAELEVVRCEQVLKDAQKRLQDISERLLPDLMEEAGMKLIQLANGTQLKVEDQLTVSPLKANRPAVLEWVRETGNGAKIKRNVVVGLGQDAVYQQEALCAVLKTGGYNDVKTEEWIEPATLKAHVKKALEAGEDVDLELLGARSFKKAKITGKPKDGSSAFGV